MDTLPQYPLCSYAPVYTVVFHKAVDDILALAEELGRGTIERVLAKDDRELGLEVLQRMMGEQER